MRIYKLVAIIVVLFAVPVSSSAASLSGNCKKGDATSCFALGMQEISAKEYGNAVTHFLRSCELGNLNGCSVGAKLYTNDLYGIQDQIAARKLIEKIWPAFLSGCVSGQSTQCLSLVQSIEEFRTVMQYSTIRPYLSSSCDANFQNACELMQDMDRENAVLYLKKACELRDPYSCIEALRFDFLTLPEPLEMTELTSEQRTERFDKVVGYSEIAYSVLSGECNSSNAISCLRLSRIVNPNDILFDKTFDRGNSILRRFVAEFRLRLFHDKDVPSISSIAVDQQTSDAYYIKAFEMIIEECNQGVAQSCYIAARMLTESNTNNRTANNRSFTTYLSPEDDAECAKLPQRDFCPPIAAKMTSMANGYFTKSVSVWDSECSAGNSMSCYQLARAYSGGAGEFDKHKVEKYYQKTVGMLNQGCKESNPLMCYQYIGMNTGIADGFISEKHIGVFPNDGSLQKAFKIAWKYYSSECDNGNGAACFAVARMISTSIIVKGKHDTIVKSEPIVVSVADLWGWDMSVTIW